MSPELSEPSPVDPLLLMWEREDRAADPVVTASAIASLEPRREPLAGADDAAGGRADVRSTGTRAAEPPMIAEVVRGASGEALSLSVEHLWQLVKDAAWAAQDARVRAARAEGEATALRREVARLRDQNAELIEEIPRGRWVRRRR